MAGLEVKDILNQITVNFVLFTHYYSFINSFHLNIFSVIFSNFMCFSHIYIYIYIMTNIEYSIPSDDLKAVD